MSGFPLATNKHTSPFFCSPTAHFHKLPPLTGCNKPNDNTNNMLFSQLKHRPTTIRSPNCPTRGTSQVQEQEQSFSKGGGLRCIIELKKRARWKKKIEEEKRSNCKELSARRDQPGGFISRPISGKKRSEKPGGNASGGLGAASDRKQIKKKRSNFNLYQGLTSDRRLIAAHIGFFREHWRFHNRIKQEATATVCAASGHKEFFTRANINVLPAVFRIQSEALITQESEWVSAFREGNNLYRQLFFCFFLYWAKAKQKPTAAILLSQTAS